MELLLHRVLVFTASILPLFLTVLSLQSIRSVSSAPPVAVAGAGYVTVNGILYIQGGADTSGNYTSAFSSLSLKTPWNNTSPPWKSIDISNHFPVLNAAQSIAATPDKTRLVFWGSFNPPQNASLITYNIPNNTWSTITLIPTTTLTGDGIRAVIDPTTPGGGLGNLYAPSGCVSITGTASMCGLPSSQKTPVTLPMPGGLVPPGLVNYSFVYCTSRKTMLLYGGMGTGPTTISNPSLYEYAASTSAWTLLQPQGIPPGDAQGHCMVETSDGTKMLMFGGMNIANQPSSSLYILHISNMTWTVGPDVGSANARAYPVCATNGDSFIVWGGAVIVNGQGVIVNNTPLIYNIPNNTWVQNFETAPPPPPPPSTKTTSASTGPTSSPSDNNASPSPKKSSSLGAAVGGAVGGIVAVAAIGFFFYRRRKRSGDSDHQPSQLKRSGNNSSARFGKKGGFLGKNNGDDTADDKDPYDNYSGAHAVQLQDTSIQRTGDPYLPSSTQFVQPLSSSPPLPPIIQHLPPRPEMQSRNMIHSYGNNPGDFVSGVDTMDCNGVPMSGQESLRFSGISSSPPPLLPFQSRQSTMSSSPTDSPQREEGSLGFSPIDPYGQSIYYDAGKNVISAGSPQGSLGSFPSYSPGQSTYYDGRSSVLSGPFKSPESHITSIPYSNSPQYVPIGSDGVRADSRSPQQIGSGNESSPAAWMAAMNARDSSGNPQAMITLGSDVSSGIGSRGSYYPPPPGPQQSPPSESDLMQKRLRLLKAQHELDLERMRLEQEAQMQTVQKQLLQNGG